MAKKENLEKVFKDLKAKVEPVIEEVLVENVDEQFHQLLKYQVSTGGKRLRPVLAIIACYATGGKLRDILYPAAALEILHNYSLIVDDIIDHSLMRRNQPTVWAKYGKSIAECVAIDYSVSVFQSLQNSARFKELSDIFAKTIKTIVDGEIWDILFERAGREDEPYVVSAKPKVITKNDYFEMVGKKTAFLFQSCCEVGGLCANGSTEAVAALKNYGFNLGVAFQVQDDILDLFAQEKEFGKGGAGKDIEERKGGNLLLLFTFEEVSGAVKRKINDIMAKKKISGTDIKQVLEIIKKTSALQKAHTLKESFIKKSKSCLKVLPQSQWTEILGDLADFVIKREK